MPETFRKCLWLPCSELTWEGTGLGFQAAEPVAVVTSRGRTAHDYLGCVYQAYDRLAALVQRHPTKVAGDLLASVPDWPEGPDLGLYIKSTVFSEL